MAKFLIGLLSFILSCAIIAGGAYMSFTKTDFEGIGNAFAEAMTNVPEMPERPVDPEDPEDPENPENPENPDIPDLPVSGEVDAFLQLFDSFDPALIEINREIINNSINNLIPEDNEASETVSNVINTYFDELTAEMDRIQTENEGATEEEQAAARQEFAEREAAAYEGLQAIVTETTTNNAAPSEEVVVESVGAILDSTVCLNTVTSIVTQDAEAVQQIQEATQTLPEETMTEIENLITDAYTNPDNEGKEETYQALADLFGITLPTT